MILLYLGTSRTGRWASVMPSRPRRDTRSHRRAAARFSDRRTRNSTHTIGLVVPAREPMTPLNAALVSGKPAAFGRQRSRIDGGCRAD